MILLAKPGGTPPAVRSGESDAANADDQEWRPKLPRHWLERPLRDLREQVGALVDREYLARLLERCDQNAARAAAVSGVNRTYLYRLLAKHRQ